MGEKRSNGVHHIPVDILDEIAARFIVNLNQEERQDIVRICFQVEEAHWFYTDFYVNQKPEMNLQSGTMRSFTEHIFRHVPFLQSHVNNVDDILTLWRTYKLKVPTYGAIILNTKMDKVLLVQGFYARSSWGFPKGKINQDEEPHICAAREVYEETGYDITSKVDPEVYVEHMLNDQPVRLYLIPGVPENTKFEPRSRCEIRDIRWFDINLLPLNKSDQNCKIKNGFNPNSFYMVIPFIREAKAWAQTKLWQRLQFQDEPQEKGRSGRKSVPRTKQEDGRTPASGVKERKISVPGLKQQTDRRTPGSSFKPSQSSVSRNMEVESSESRRNQENMRNSKSKVKGSRRQLFETGQDTSRESTVTPQDKLGSFRPALLPTPGSNPAQLPTPGSNPINNLNKSKENRSNQQPSLLPPNFCPKAWSNFRLDENTLISAFFNTGKPRIK
ncbi:m7GpppN-mRNA hydrolase isoform X2 [Eurytemora carolleeae]|uniref:m7GpppN-mRNA hydrolase isoform X2 n=1 Tax=Eurytemora carolleeae TaxID=1294199 RepID=UPI000C77CE04|nr:m7GpppN-mRNA hydrolase isoform X2 [Eurytemora carolleeae]|eukprot:XP_023336993.1 m7GpppN-mRNA hydrolase-like isoform X2 [Eurytemora affinis]